MANQIVPGMQFTCQQQKQQPQPQPQPFIDTTNTKIFVGGLAWETKSDMLRRFFEPFGDILEAVVITDKHTGRSKGYGFVTFRDPEAAKRACANPNPVIDCRRANCNLASLGRPVQLLPPGNLRSASLYFRGPQTPQGMYVGNPMYQLPANFGYHPRLQFSPYRYPAYGPEYFYPQMYGVPGPVSPNSLVYSQMGNPPPASFGYTPVRGYMLQHTGALQYGRPIMAGMAPEFMSPNHPGIRVASPVPIQIMVPTSPSQFTQSSGSDQMTG